MPLLQRLGAWLLRKESSVGPLISAGLANQPVWTPRKYDDLAREAYVENPIANACIRTVSIAGASVPLMLRQTNGDLIEEHPILDLLARPNPREGGIAFLRSIYAYLAVAGNAYVEGVVGSLDSQIQSGAAPNELWCHRPDRITVIPGERGLPAAYEYSANGQERRWEVDQVNGLSPILHIREFHPTNDWYGLARTEPAAFGVDRHNASSAHNMALLQNGARPSGALVFEPIQRGDADPISPPKEFIDRAEAQLRSRHQGPNNAGRPMVMSGLVRWLDMALSPRDMDFEASKSDAARDICTAYGVPHLLIVPGEATYNNIREAKLELYENTIMPLVMHVVSELNNWLVPVYGEGLDLVADWDAVPALEPRREQKRQSVVGLLEKGVLDTDEARAELDFGDWPEESVKRVDATVLSALIKSTELVGIQPLLRYLRYVRLVPEGISDEELMAEALRIIGDMGDATDALEDDDDGDTPPDEDAEPGEDEEEAE